VWTSQVRYRSRGDIPASSLDVRFALESEQSRLYELAPWSTIGARWLVNGIARERARKLGDTYVDVPIDAFEESDFWDEGHFLPKGSAKFARMLAPAIANACRCRHDAKRSAP
jgi:hypothetical protein